MLKKKNICASLLETLIFKIFVKIPVHKEILNNLQIIICY